MKKSQLSASLVLAVLTAVASHVLTSSASAQQPWPSERESPSDSAAYWASPKMPSPEELRQQYAIEKRRQRQKQIQYNQWRGYSPLRPVSSAVPMMRSNYVGPYYRAFYVPYVTPVVPMGVIAR